MHICFIIGALNYSGAEKVLTIVAKELYRNKNKVSVVLLEKPNGTIENIDGILTYGAKATGIKLQRVISRWRNIRNNIKKVNPDIVVSFGSVCNTNAVPSLIGTNYPLVLCERNDPIYDPKKRSERFFRWFLYRFADGYVFQTEKIKSYFSKKIRSKAAIIENPLIRQNYMWNSSNHEKSIVTVARLDNFQKDHITMFNAFKIFHAYYPDYVLDIYGEGPDRNIYEKIISDMGLTKSIILHGKCKNPVEKLIHSEIFLLTSKYEGMPNALMEAMSIGMPCISTDCGGGGAKALFDMTDSGILVPSGDAEAIAKALIQLIHNEKLKSKIADNALRINHYLDKRRICDKWEIYLKTFV